MVNERTAAMPRFGGQLETGRQLGDVERAELLEQVLPILRGALSSQRHNLLTVDTSPRAIELASSVDAERLVRVGAACPDHLVHTKRLPLWVPFDPTQDDATALGDRVRSLAASYRDDYCAYVDRFANATTVPADPNARVVIIQNVGLVSAGTTTKASALARDLYHRAIEVMAGAQALGAEEHRQHSERRRWGAGGVPALSALGGGDPKPVRRHRPGLRGESDFALSAVLAELDHELGRGEDGQVVP